jgi:uncharacterized protein with ParB-like and HNH nuclease domain
MMIEEQTKDILEGEEDSNDIYPNATVKISKEQFSIYDLKRQYEQRHNIIIEPNFQRNEVWNTKQKSELIESVLMGIPIPIPILYFFEGKDGKRQVVDGRGVVAEIEKKTNKKSQMYVKIRPDKNHAIRVLSYD